MVPLVRPANPPTVLFGPVLVTAPEAVEAVISPGPFSKLSVPMKPPSTLLPPPVTDPVAALDRMVPLPVPTRPPASRFAMFGLPTLPVANALVMLPVLSATSPPAVPFVPTLTAPLAQAWPAAQSRFAGTVVPAIAPAFCPTSPPAKAELPPATLPSAKELLIVAPRRLEPTKPPTRLNAPPVTSPLADEPVMVPRLVATSPPAIFEAVVKLESPTLTVAAELELAITPLLF
jgi:hypothetical protein